MERNVLVGGIVLNTHETGTCIGEYCTIHKFSDHHMVKWKQDWLLREMYMVRICPHGSTHPDPDEISLNVPENHGCDGCCDPASQFEEDAKELRREYPIKGESFDPSEILITKSSGAHLHIGENK